MNEKKISKFKPIKEQTYFIASIIAFCLLVSCYLTYATYRNCVQEYQSTLSGVSHEIRKIIYTTLTEVKNIITYLGKEIVESGTENIEEIAHHLTQAQKSKEAEGWTCSWTNLAWINSQKYMLANSLYGVAKNPIYIDQYQFVFDAPKAPWEFMTCPPAWGVISTLKIIPVGMGFSDSEGDFKGYISSGISIQDLTQKLKAAVKNIASDFIITDDEQNIICHSFNEDEQGLKTLAQKLFNAFKCKEKESAELSSPLRSQSIDFYTYQQVSPYPVYIFVGIDRTLVQSAFYRSLLPHLLEITFFGFLSIALLYVIHKRITKPLFLFSDNIAQVPFYGSSVQIPWLPFKKLNELGTRLQEVVTHFQNQEPMLEKKKKHLQDLQATLQQWEIKNEETQCVVNELRNLISSLTYSKRVQETFMEKSYREWQASLKIIEIHCETFLRHLQGNLDLPLNNDHRLLLLENILKTTHRLKTSHSEELTLSKISLKEVLTESKVLHLKNLVAKKIQVEIEVDPSIEFIVADGFKLKQVFSGILFRIIQYMPTSGKIQITASMKHQEKLQITLVDNGFGLTEEEIGRLEKRFEKENRESFNPTAPSLDTIRQLITVHDGCLEIETKWKEGTQFMITLPYFSPHLFLKRIENEKAFN